MDIIILVVVGITCAYTAAGVFNSKERNTVFNRRMIRVTDVQKYNRECGWLVVGFGIAAELTLFIGFALGSITSAIAPILLIVEAAAVIKIYEKIEKKYIDKNH